MSEFLKRLEDEIQNRRLLLNGQKILVGVSGGVDSMALLHALQLLAGKRRWKIAVMHFNHQLRGHSSDADERFVRKTAVTLGLSFITGGADVKQFAQGSKISIEMAARKLRHDFFSQVARERKASTIALAHHSDDQLELFFLRMLRGAGGEGLAGMKWRVPSPVNLKINLVRPFLGFSKKEILGFAKAQKISFRDDATNFSMDFLRNRIRNELLPLLLEKYQPGLAKTILRLMDIVGAEADQVGQMARNWLGQHQTVFEKLSIAVQRRVLQLQLTGLKMSPDFDLIESLRLAATVPVDIGPQSSISRNAKGIVGIHVKKSEVEFNANELAVNLKNRAGEAIFGKVSLSWQFARSKKKFRSQKITAREFFDADKIGSRIILRHWRPGDRFQPIAMVKSVKLQDLFTNAKIPLGRRRGLIVATTANEEIFWVEGLRISENFKLLESTKRHLIWRWQR